MVKLRTTSSKEICFLINAVLITSTIQIGFTLTDRTFTLSKPVISATLNKDHSRNITLTMPNTNDTSPSARCLFVFVYEGMEGEVPEEFTEQDFMDESNELLNIWLSFNVSSDELNLDDSRIISAKLGKESNTSCQLFEDQNPINGGSRNLQPYKYYKVIAVLATRYDDTPTEFKWSDVATFKNDLPMQDSQWIIQTVIGSIIFLIILVLAIRWKRRQMKKPPKKKPDITSSGFSTTHTNFPTAQRRIPGASFPQNGGGRANMASGNVNSAGRPAQVNNNVAKNQRTCQAPPSKAPKTVPRNDFLV